ncbi:MAG: S9 family peptidase [Anaerolineae bacterium]|nr:S9 family peptidase [Anaerolineae bacterium]
MTQEKRPITADDLYKIVYVEEPRISPDGRWVAYVHVAPDKLENGYRRNIWLAPASGGEPVQLTRGGKDSSPRWSPDGTMLAFVSKRGDEDAKPQIYAIPVTAPGGEARALTEAPGGASAPAWSPDGKRIAYLAKLNAAERVAEDAGAPEAPPADKFEADQRKARKKHDDEQYFDPLVVERIPYREGTTYRDGRFAQIYVTGLGEEEKPHRLTDIDADHDAPRWTPDGKCLLTARVADLDVDEPWRWTRLYRIDAASGEAVQLTGDIESADHGPVPSPDGKWIAYERLPGPKSGNLSRLSVIPAAGGARVDLTAALDRTPIAFEWAHDGSALFFVANVDGVTPVYTVAPAGGDAALKLTGTIEIQGFDVSAGGDLAFAASTPLRPPELFWQPAGAPVDQGAARLTAVNAALLEEVIVRPTHDLAFTAPDGQQVQGWYILPVGYEEGKQYPLAFNVHGGPHAMWSAAARSMWHEWQFHAARGYVVFYCNPRGSDGYGEAFRRACVGAWGDADLPDLMAGIDALLAKGFVDATRMAITGGSYGGFMTAWVIGHTDRFAAAVSQRGVYNMFSMFGTTDIPIFNADELGDIQPWDDPEKYWQYSPLAYAHEITTPLLIIHSANDFRVPVSEGEQLFAFVRRNGGTVKLVRYPRDGHELSRSGEPKHRVSRLTEMVNWFDKYCMPEDNKDSES